MSLFTFFFHDTATTEIYTYGHTLSLHDALPIWRGHATRTAARSAAAAPPPRLREPAADPTPAAAPSRGRRQPAAVRPGRRPPSCLFARCALIRLTNTPASWGRRYDRRAFTARAGEPAHAGDMAGNREA